MYEFRGGVVKSVRLLWMAPIRKLNVVISFQMDTVLIFDTKKSIGEKTDDSIGEIHNHAQSHTVAIMYIYAGDTIF